MRAALLALLLLLAGPAAALDLAPQFATAADGVSGFANAACLGEVACDAEGNCAGLLSDDPEAPDGQSVSNNADGTRTLRIGFPAWHPDYRPNPDPDAQELAILFHVNTSGVGASNIEASPGACEGATLAGGCEGLTAKIDLLCNGQFVEEVASGVSPQGLQTFAFTNPPDCVTGSGVQFEIELNRCNGDQSYYAGIDAIEWRADDEPRPFATEAVLPDNVAVVSGTFHYSNADDCTPHTDCSGFNCAAALTEEPDSGGGDGLNFHYTGPYPSSDGTVDIEFPAPSVTLDMGADAQEVAYYISAGLSSANGSDPNSGCSVLGVNQSCVGDIAVDLYCDGVFAENLRSGFSGISPTQGAFVDSFTVPAGCADGQNLKLRISNLLNCDFFGSSVLSQIHSVQWNAEGTAGPPPEQEILKPDGADRTNRAQAEYDVADEEVQAVTACDVVNCEDYVQNQGAPDNDKVFLQSSDPFNWSFPTPSGPPTDGVNDQRISITKTCYSNSPGANCSCGASTSDHWVTCGGVPTLQLANDSVHSSEGEVVHYDFTFPAACADDGSDLGFAFSDFVTCGTFPADFPAIDAIDWVASVGGPPPEPSRRILMP